jgi:hypothetical protein
MLGMRILNIVRSGNPESIITFLELLAFADMCLYLPVCTYVMSEHL